MIQVHLEGGQMIKGYQPRAQLETLCKQMKEKKIIKIQCCSGPCEKLNYFSK